MFLNNFQWSGQSSSSSHITAQAGKTLHNIRKKVHVCFVSIRSYGLMQCVIFNTETDVQHQWFLPINFDMCPWFPAVGCVSNFSTTHFGSPDQFLTFKCHWTEGLSFLSLGLFVGLKTSRHFEKGRNTPKRITPFQDATAVLNHTQKDTLPPFRLQG